MNAPTRFVIENGEQVTVYDDQNNVGAGEFLEAVLDLVSNNDSCLIETQRKDDAVYLKLL
jgi:hypothetical protein